MTWSRNATVTFRPTMETRSRSPARLKRAIRVASCYLFPFRGRYCDWYTVPNTLAQFETLNMTKDNTRCWGVIHGYRVSTLNNPITGRAAAANDSGGNSAAGNDSWEKKSVDIRLMGKNSIFWMSIHWHSQTIENWLCAKKRSNHKDLRYMTLLFMEDVIVQ